MCRLAQITLYPIALEGGDRYIGLPCFHPQYVPKRTLDCGSSSYRLPPSIHTINRQRAEEEKR